MDNTNNLSSPVIHVFEAAGLGKGPFKLAAVTAQGGACQFCNTPILFRFYIAGQDSRSFFVGSDCVMKTGDVGLMRVVEMEVKKRQAELRHEREKATLEMLRGHLTQPAVMEGLKGRPHPFTWYAKQGKTMLDYAEWIMRFGGNTAKKNLAKTLLPAQPRGRKKNTQATA